MSALGAAAGVALAWLLTRIAMSISLPIPIPLSFALRIDGRVLLFTAGVTMIAAVVAGLAPALKATRPNLVNELKSDVAATQAGGRRWTLRDGLVVTQIAVTMVLLVAAGLLTRSLLAAQHVEHRLPHRRPRHRLDRDEHGRLRRDAREGVLRSRARARAGDSGRRVGGAGRAAAVLDQLQPQQRVPARSARARTTRASCSTSRACRRSTSRRSASPMFRAATSRRPTRRRRRASRSSTRRWRESTGRIRTRIGKRIRLLTYDGPRCEVVGVSADYKVSTVGEGATPYMHYAVSQQPDSGEEIVARTRGDAGALLAAMRRELLALEPNVLFLDNQTMDAQVAATLLPAKAGAISVSAVGVVAMVLASIGLYGVIAYSVARRTREIGIRMALGAQPSAVVGLVMKQGLRLAAVGVGVGAVLALGAAKAVAGALYGVSFVDPIAWSAAIATLLRSPRWRTSCRRAARRSSTRRARCDPSSAAFDRRRDGWSAAFSARKAAGQAERHRDSRSSANAGHYVQIAHRHRLPPHPDRAPQQPAEERIPRRSLADGRGEVRVDHERDAGEQLRPPLLFLAVDEQHEPDAARNEREEQPGRVEVHRSIIAPAQRPRSFIMTPMKRPLAVLAIATLSSSRRPCARPRPPRNGVHRRRGDDPGDADGDGAGARSPRARWSSST